MTHDRLLGHINNDVTIARLPLSQFDELMSRISAS
jgi:hypothetical protein